MLQFIPYLIAVLITAAIVGPLSWIQAIKYRKRTYEEKIGSAEVKSREIIEEALKTAESKKREFLLEAKEESLKTRNELEKEVKERRSELQRYEKQVLSKEEKIEKKQELIDKKELAISEKEEKIAERSREVESLYEQGIEELQKISGLTTEQAKVFLLQTIEEDVKHDKAKLIKELDNKAKEEAEKKAREYIVTAIPTM